MLKQQTKFYATFILCEAMKNSEASVMYEVRESLFTSFCFEFSTGTVSDEKFTQVYLFKYYCNFNNLMKPRQCVLSSQKTLMFINQQLENRKTIQNLVILFSCLVIIAYMFFSAFGASGMLLRLGVGCIFPALGTGCLCSARP